MYFSGKITNSIISHILRNSSESERLYELTDLPMEMLKDPTCWIEAPKVEAFLETVEKEFSFLNDERSFISTVGRNCSELRSWGVLDSVLRMMQDPQDIFAQPEKLLSYFISPAPPVANLVKNSDSIGFDWPLSPEEYPYFSEYLIVALESLPTFGGKSLASVRWLGSRLEIDWKETQSSFFEDQPQDVNLKPELIRSLIQSLEEAQFELETKKKELMVKDQEIEMLKTKSKPVDPSESALSDEQMVVLENLRSQFYRMSDYLGRASQLVTLLVKQDRMDRQVSEAMKRVDWDRIVESVPELRSSLSESVETLTTPFPKSKTAPIRQTTLNH